MGKTADAFSTSAICIAPSSTVKAVQEGDFQVTANTFAFVFPNTGRWGFVTTPLRMLSYSQISSERLCTASL